MQASNSRTEHKACETRVLEEYGHIRRIREIITDHGTQFYANKRDKKGNAEHSFEQYLKSENVKHILCRYNHSQSNGKVERWFQELQETQDGLPHS